MKIYNKGKNNPRYIDGRTLRKYYCANCGKEISIGSKRCRSCAAKKQWQDDEFKKSMSGKNNPNYVDGRCLKKYFCIDCGKEINVYSKRCHSCDMKTKRQDGCFDGVYTSPTKPEKEIMEILKEKNLDYIFQFRPKNFSMIYDFHVSSLNLLIEYDGSYWHSSEKAQRNDKKKTRYAVEHGYDLLRVNENNFDIIKSL